MLHESVLKVLFPLELGGVSDADFAIEGAQLDSVQTRAEQLLAEAFPDSAVETIADWERVCDITPGATDTLQQRRNRVTAKLQELGGQTPAYFTALATTLGYTITIEENIPGESIFVWRVTVTGQPIFQFWAGESSAGDSLLDWTAAGSLEGLFEDLKPAHTRIIFQYV